MLPTYSEDLSRKGMARNHPEKVRDISLLQQVKNLLFDDLSHHVPSSVAPSSLNTFFFTLLDISGRTGALIKPLNDPKFHVGNWCYATPSHSLFITFLVEAAFPLSTFPLSTRLDDFLIIKRAESMGKPKIFIGKLGEMPLLP